jgi:flagellar biogenesis protein FliO
MEFAQQIALVVIVLGVLAAVLKIAKDRGFAQFATRAAATHSRRMRALERLSLSPNHSLHLVTVDGKTVLVSVSPAGCQILENPSSGDRR